MVVRSLAKTSPRTRTARARSLATRTALRSTRSAMTPASGLAMVGSRRATSAPPTAEALPVISTTRTTSATMETASPTKEVPWPIQSRKKREFLKKESLVESISYPRQRDPSPGSGRMYSWQREPPSSLTDGTATRLLSSPWKAFHGPGIRLQVQVMSWDSHPDDPVRSAKQAKVHGISLQILLLTLGLVEVLLHLGLLEVPSGCCCKPCR